jgi:hypothetical protein
MEMSKSKTYALTTSTGIEAIITVRTTPSNWIGCSTASDIFQVTVMDFKLNLSTTVRDNFDLKNAQICGLY